MNIESVKSIDRHFHTVTVPDPLYKITQLPATPERLGMFSLKECFALHHLKDRFFSNDVLPSQRTGKCLTEKKQHKHPQNIINKHNVWKNSFLKIPWNAACYSVGLTSFWKWMNTIDSFVIVSKERPIFKQNVIGALYGLTGYLTWLSWGFRSDKL